MKVEVIGNIAVCEKGCRASFNDEETAQEWAKEHEAHGHAED